MRKFLLLFTIFLSVYISSNAQGLSYTCPRDTILGCGVNCFDLFVKFPDIRDLGDDYAIQNNSTTSQCYPFLPPGEPGPSTNLIIDDRYSSVIPLPFPFRFYGSTYNSLIVSTNGFISFDITETGLFSHYDDEGNLPNNLYDAAIIMGPYHDLDPSITTSPTQQIKYQTFGTAPHRKWVLSYYRVPLFDCDNLIENTHQIILHETTGIVEVDIVDKQICYSWNDGHSMIGMQNFAKTKGIMAPNRKMTDPPWGSIGMNEVWRFVPTGGAPLYRSVELLDASGVTVATGDTVRQDAATFGWTFPNICPPTNAPTLYVVKTTYVDLTNPTQMVSSLDTIYVTRNAMPLSATTTSAACGVSNGSVTVTATGGTPPLTYTLNPGAISNITGIFTGLTAGTYTVTVTDASGNCTNTISATVDLISNLTGTFVRTNASCPGVNNGSITVTPTSGTAPYTYSANGGTSQASGIFTNLTPGTYTIVFTDASGCTGSITTTIGPGSNISASATSTSASCAGASNGSITVTASGGVGPYTYSLNGGTPQTSNVFTGVPPGTHVISVVDSRGCTISEPETVGSGTGLTGSIFSTPVSCPGNTDGTITLNPTSGVAPYTYQLNGGPSQTSNNFTGLSASPPSYTVTFTDANGCQGSRSINVGGGTAPSTSATAANTSCAGSSDGVIVFQPVAGSVYTVNPGGYTNTTGTFTNLPTGIYTLGIATSGGCAGTVSPATITISAGAGLTTTATTSAASCTASSDGSITVTPSGTGTTTYTLNPGAVSNTTGIFTGLAAGSYTITFVTSAGCNGTVAPNPVVSTAATPTTTATTAATTCPGVNDGTITVTPIGTGTTTYTLNPGAVSNTTGIFTGLAAGAYTITFVTSNGCNGNVTGSPTVTSGPAPTSTATATATTCPGANDGTVTVATVGTGTTYTLNPGAISNTTGVFTGLSSGIYTITFVTASGCNGTVTNNPQVTNGTAPTSTATTTATTCPGVNDGTLTVAPVGTGTTTYTLNPGAISNTTGIFTGLASGSYTISFVTSAGCNGTVTGNPFVNQGTAPTSTATATPTTCPGVNDGTVTVTPVGTGTTYTLNPGAVSNTTGIFNSLAPGVYTITFVTAAGCNGTVPVNPEVLTGPAPTTTATATNSSCPTVNDGIITVATVAPGTIYTLNPGAVSNSTGVFTGLAPGSYTITFVTAAGCNGTTVPAATTVSAGPFRNSTFTKTDPVCNNINDGTISITPTAPSAGPYTVTLTGPGGPYTLSGNAPVTFTALAPGTYNYSFTDAGGCTGTGGPVVLVTNPPIFTPAAFVNPSCNGNSNGSVTFSPIGGVAPYQYSINGGGSYQATNVFNGLAVGTHNFRIRDNVGCTKDTSITLTEPAILVGSVTGTTPAGCSNNDGTLTATANGGTAPYSYTIAGATVNTSGASTGIFTGLANGAYTITVRDAQGCTDDITATVTLTDNMFLTLGPDVTICAESSVTFDPQTNAETNVFTWRGINGTNTNTIANPNIKNAVASPLDTATYELHAQWGGCERKDTIVVNVLRKPVANAGLDTAICNLTYAILRGSAGNLSGGVTYEWTPSTNIEFPTQDVTRVFPAGSDTTYTYTLIVRDTYGCNFAVSDQVDVRVQPPVPAFAGNDTTAVRGTPHQLMASGGDDYLWSPSAPLNNASLQNPLATLQQDQKFVVRVTDFAGCIGYDTVFVKVFVGPAYYVPNAFTPNGDGLNDVFRPVPVGVVRTEWFRVFNRYGETIFETNQWMKGWDGTFKGKKQPVGAYVWVIKGIDRDGKVIEMKGTVMLVQ